MIHILVIFVVFPLTDLLHELGHGFAIIITKNQLKKISIGKGKTILNIKKFTINRYYMIGGEFEYTKKENISLLNEIFIMAAGILFNLILILILISFNYDNYLINAFIYINLLTIIVNIIPKSLGDLNTDGKQILDLITLGYSTYKKE